MNLKKIILIGVLLGTTLIANDKTIILQNGVNGYTGTIDQWAKLTYQTAEYPTNLDSTHLFIMQQKKH